MYSKIQVDFFKESGKWYAGGEVYVGDVTKSLLGDIKQKIVDNQEILGEGWQGNFVVVIRDIEEDFKSKDYTGFNNAFFYKDEFEGMKRK